MDAPVPKAGVNATGPQQAAALIRTSGTRIRTPFGKTVIGLVDGIVALRLAFLESSWSKFESSVDAMKALDVGECVFAINIQLCCCCSDWPAVCVLSVQRECRQLWVEKSLTLDMSCIAWV